MVVLNTTTMCVVCKRIEPSVRQLEFICWYLEQGKTIAQSAQGPLPYSFRVLSMSSHRPKLLKHTSTKLSVFSLCERYAEEQKLNIPHLSKRKTQNAVRT